MDDKEILLEEWKDIRETLRYFGNKRFAQLTVFLAAEGAAISAFLGAGHANPNRVFQIAGLLLAVLFFIIGTQFRELLETICGARGRNRQHLVELGSQ